jgi:transcriptional regulator with PAS, ATPase and Fis domain
LRERKEDLPDLAHALLSRINRDMRHKVTRVASEVMDRFSAYDWPGNVLGLENLLLKAVALSQSNVITPDLIPDYIGGVEGRDRPVSQEASSVQLSLAEVDKAHIKRVLDATNWHKGRACDILGVSRPRLRRLIAQYGLVPPPDRGVADSN